MRSPEQIQLDKEYFTEEKYIQIDEENVFIPGSNAQMRLIQVLSDINNVGKTVKEKCELANCCRNTYFNVRKLPRFKEALGKMILARVGMDHQTELVQRTLHFALTDPKCHADRRMLWEAMELAKNKKEININKKSVNIDMSVEKMTTEELRQFIVNEIKNDPGLIEGIKIETADDEEEPEPVPTIGEDIEDLPETEYDDYLMNDDDEYEDED